MHLKVHGFLQMQAHNHMLLYEQASLAFLATTRILYTNLKNTS